MDVLARTKRIGRQSEPLPCGLASSALLHAYGYVCVSMNLHEYMYTTHMQYTPVEARIGHWLP